jgi:hypothetical protein
MKQLIWLIFWGVAGFFVWRTSPKVKKYIEEKQLNEENFLLSQEKHRMASLKREAEEVLQRVEAEQRKITRVQPPVAPKTKKTPSTSVKPKQPKTISKPPRVEAGSPVARSTASNPLEIFKTQVDACAEALKVIRKSEMQIVFMSRAELDAHLEQVESIHAEAARLYKNALGMGSSKAHIEAVNNAFANFRESIIRYK